mmetsp:Transcript_37763/g.61191  ORF Transcript_37763/g.61191 Transcript_37763/m.61191 type:complete len:120 (-) Transcript_37763:1055-1414(-)
MCVTGFLSTSNSEASQNTYLEESHSEAVPNTIIEQKGFCQSNKAPFYQSAKSKALLNKTTVDQSPKSKAHRNKTTVDKNSITEALFATGVMQKYRFQWRPAELPSRWICEACKWRYHIG